MSVDDRPPSCQRGGEPCQPPTKDSPPAAEAASTAATAADAAAAAAVEATAESTDGGGGGSWGGLGAGLCRSEVLGLGLVEGPFQGTLPERDGGA